MIMEQENGSGKYYKTGYIELGKLESVNSEKVQVNNIGVINHETNLRESPISSELRAICS
mgnify:CR=1 FL=1